MAACHLPFLPSMKRSSFCLYQCATRQFNPTQCYRWVHRQAPQLGRMSRGRSATPQRSAHLHIKPEHEHWTVIWSRAYTHALHSELEISSKMQLPTSGVFFFFFLSLRMEKWIEVERVNRNCALNKNGALTFSQLKLLTLVFYHVLLACTYSQILHWEHVKGGEGCQTIVDIKTSFFIFSQSLTVPHVTWWVTVRISHSLEDYSM